MQQELLCRERVVAQTPSISLGRWEEQHGFVVVVVVVVLGEGVWGRLHVHDKTYSYEMSLKSTSHRLVSAIGLFSARANSGQGCCYCLLLG